MTQNSPDGRRVHTWRGRDRKEDIDELVAAIAASVAGLCSSHEGTIFRLDGTMVGRNAFRELVDEHICGCRALPCDGGYQYDYYTFAWAPRPRFIPTWEKQTPDPKLELQPDEKALFEVFEELPSRLPRIEKG